MPPELSIILPVNDNRQSLPHAIDSIFAQTFEDWELIIIADGSPQPVKSFLSGLKDPRVRIIHLSHGGIARAINTGIRFSQGELIGRMDADDRCEPQRFSKQVAYLNNHPDTGVVACQVTYEGEGEGFARFVRWQNGLLTHKQLYNCRFQEAVITHPSVVFRKKLFFKFGGYVETGDVPEDFELWLRFFQSGVRMEKIPEKLLAWHDSSSRLSRNHHAYSEMMFCKVKANYLAGHLRNTGKELYVIGRGSRVNQKIAILRKAGLEITKMIDVKVHPGNAMFISFEEIHRLENAFIVSLVRDRNGRMAIEAYLNSAGLMINEDYLLLE